MVCGGWFVVVVCGGWFVVVVCGGWFVVVVCGGELWGKRFNGEWFEGGYGG